MRRTSDPKIAGVMPLPVRTAGGGTSLTAAAPRRYRGQLTCPLVRQTSSCWRSDWGTASRRAAHRLPASGASTGGPDSSPSTARRNGQIDGSGERSSSIGSQVSPVAPAIATAAVATAGSASRAPGTEKGRVGSFAASSGVSDAARSGASDGVGVSVAASIAAVSMAVSPDSTGTAGGVDAPLSGARAEVFDRRRSLATLGSW